jgi:hypothetical protein
MENNGRTLIVLLVVAIVIAISAYIYYDFGRDEETVVPEPTNSTRDETDQSETNEEDEWLFATSTSYSFQYPEDLETEYLELVDWPPEVRLSEETFACEEAGEETEVAGRTESVTVGGMDYCRTTISEGAAGSVYTQYAYAFAQDDGSVFITFSTRSPQCANYDAAERSDCEDGLDEFNPDELADRMARTLVLE